MTNLSSTSNKNCNEGNIYTRLVIEACEQGRSLEGYIAYTLYKGDKLEYIETFKASHPTASDSTIQKEKDKFRISHCTESAINKYKKNAADIVENVHVYNMRKLYSDALTHESEQFTKNIAKSCNVASTNFSKSIESGLDSWWRKGRRGRTLYGVLQSVVGAIIYALLLAIFAFIIKNSDGIQLYIGTAK